MLSGGDRTPRRRADGGQRQLDRPPLVGLEVEVGEFETCPVDPVARLAGAVAGEHFGLDRHPDLAQRRLVPLERGPQRRLLGRVLALHLAGDLDQRQRTRRLQQQRQEVVVSDRLDAGPPSSCVRTQTSVDGVADHRGDDLVTGRTGGEHAGDACLEQLRYVDVGHDAADHHGDVDAELADLLDDQRGQRHVGAGQHRQPDGVDVLVDGGRGDGLGRLEQAGVDDLEPGIAEDPGDDLDPAVVAVEADLGHENPARWALTFHRSHLP